MELSATQILREFRFSKKSSFLTMQTNCILIVAVSRASVAVQITVLISRKIWVGKNSMYVSTMFEKFRENIMKSNLVLNQNYLGCSFLLYCHTFFYSLQVCVGKSSYY